VLAADDVEGGLPGEVGVVAGCSPSVSYHSANSQPTEALSARRPVDGTERRIPRRPGFQVGQTARRTARRVARRCGRRETAGMSVAGRAVDGCNR
jgi:hypothetical protein